VGKCAEFWAQGQSFGYGWISKRSQSAGELISNWALGDEKYQSGFDYGILDGNVIHCSGWTRAETGGAQNGWFCNVDIGAAFADDPVILPAPIDATDLAIPADGRPAAGRD
jgi:hypothetical protein